MTQNNRMQGPETADTPIGRIVSVTGSTAIMQLDHTTYPEMATSSCRPEMGTLIKVETETAVALGLVSSLNIPVPRPGKESEEIWIVELELVGELPKNSDGALKKFRRGVTRYPALGDRAFMASPAELKLAYLSDSSNTISVGTIHQDESIPATVSVNDLLGKHFSILGSTGTGKSCSVALILRAILDKNPYAHIILLDPHNEYSQSFGTMAEVIKPGDLRLPFWLFTFEEFVEVVIPAKETRQEEVEILAELIPVAKANYGTDRPLSAKNRLMRRSTDNGGFSVDIPVPYRIADLLRLIDERMGMLENKNRLVPYRLLKARIEAIMQDPRYGFMFGNASLQDRMADILGHIFRIPVDSKPITIMELTGLPSEAINVVVSVLCRLTFDFALWSDSLVPITLVCEEAHKYLPKDKTLGFEPTRRSLTRIAKEGRKYGVSLCIVSQRPSELDPTILSQCNTVFAMRLANDCDQQIVASAVTDSASGLIDFLPSLGMREAIAFGDGVTLPVRIRFGELPEQYMPKGRTAEFTEKWRQQIGDARFLQKVVDRWRAATTPRYETHSSIQEDRRTPTAADRKDRAPARANARADGCPSGTPPPVYSPEPELAPAGASLGFAQHDPAPATIGLRASGPASRSQNGLPWRK